MFLPSFYMMCLFSLTNQHPCTIIIHKLLDCIVGYMQHNMIKLKHNFPSMASAKDYSLNEFYFILTARMLLWYTIYTRTIWGILIYYIGISFLQGNINKIGMWMFHIYFWGMVDGVLHQVVDFGLVFDVELYLLDLVP